MGTIEKVAGRRAGSGTSGMREKKGEGGRPLLFPYQTALEGLEQAIINWSYRADLQKNQEIFQLHYLSVWKFKWQTQDNREFQAIIPFTAKPFITNGERNNICFLHACKRAQKLSLAEETSNDMKWRSFYAVSLLQGI